MATPCSAFSIISDARSVTRNGRRLASEAPRMEQGWAAKYLFDVPLRLAILVLAVSRMHSRGQQGLALIGLRCSLKYRSDVTGITLIPFLLFVLPHSKRKRLYRALSYNGKRSCSEPTENKENSMPDTEEQIVAKYIKGAKALNVLAAKLNLDFGKEPPTVPKFKPFKGTTAQLEKIKEMLKGKMVNNTGWTTILGYCGITGTAPVLAAREALEAAEVITVEETDGVGRNKGKLIWLSDEDKPKAVTVPA